MLYSMNLLMSGRNAVVIGGGKVACRKVRGLLEAGAKVKVVSPELTSELMSLAEAGEISWQPEQYKEKDLEGALLVIAATNDTGTNLEVKKNASPHQLVNLADNPEQSDFQVPSVMKRGKLTIAVSTSGASPVLAKRIRGQLEQTYDENYESYLEFLAISREKIKAAVKKETVKRKLLREIAEESFLVCDEREERFARLLKKEISGEGK